MINATEARQLMKNAKEEQRKAASAYLFSQFKTFESQIEHSAKMGRNCVALRFLNRDDSFYEITDVERENIIRNYYEPLGYTVRFDSNMSCVFVLCW